VFDCNYIYCAINVKFAPELSYSVFLRAGKRTGTHSTGDWVGHAQFLWVKMEYLILMLSEDGSLGNQMNSDQKIP
jgi:hypothetical protein